MTSKLWGIVDIVQKLVLDEMGGQTIKGKKNIEGPRLGQLGHFCHFGRK